VTNDGGAVAFTMPQKAGPLLLEPLNNPIGPNDLTLRATIGPSGDLVGTLVSTGSVTSNTFSGGLKNAVLISAVKGDPPSPANPVAIAGVAESASPYAGTFTGFLESWDYYDLRYGCSGAFGWTLTPQ